MSQAVAAGDRALALGLTRAELEAGLLVMERWPGVRAARRVVAFLDIRSESAGESMSRVRLMEEGLPRPELQQEIFGPDGRLVAPVDFGWEAHKTVGEFDGKIKYGRLLEPGQRIEDVIFDEKIREDAVREPRLAGRALDIARSLSARRPSGAGATRLRANLLTPLRITYSDSASGTSDAKLS